jgi:pimeloyl-ACP methyl ester carboxylesterase
LTWAGIVRAEDQPIEQQTKPTILLVHGAWADSSSWNGVVDLLLKDGYTVRALPNTLRGLSADAAVISTYLKSVAGPVVLAGHSYGGAVIKRCFRQRPEREGVGVRRCIRARRRGIDSFRTRERSAAAVGFHDCGTLHGIQRQ